MYLNIYINHLITHLQTNISAGTSFFDKTLHKFCEINLLRVLCEKKNV